MVRKKLKLQLHYSRPNPLNVKILPNEVWCIIFSYLDKKAVQNATESCKHWFELIRNEPNLSGHICLADDGLLELTRKIDDSQWIWTRWPVLKTLELGKRFIGEIFRECVKSKRFTPAIGTNNEVTKYLSKSTSLRNCTALEKVVCWISWHLTGLFPNLPNLPRNFGSIYALTIDPRIEIESASIEHVSDLELSIDDSRFSEGGDPTFIGDILQAMKLIGENGRNLKDLTISFPFFPCWINPEFSQLLQDAFSDMFKGLKKYNSLQIVELNLENNLENFNNPGHIRKIITYDFTAMVTHLILKTMSCASDVELVEYLSAISYQFPKLQHLMIETAILDKESDWDEVRSSNLWSSQVENTFQDFTKVEIYLKPETNDDGYSRCGFHLVKMPFQKSVYKTVEVNLELFKNSIHHLDIFPRDFGELVTNLIVKTMPSACGDNLSDISRLFPLLRCLCIETAILADWDDFRSPKLWKDCVESAFQDFTKVKIYLKPTTANEHCFHLLKIPFQKSVIQKIIIDPRTREPKPRPPLPLDLTNPSK